MSSFVNEQENPLVNYYDGYDEEGRLLSKHGQVEFLTTMRYIERYLKPGANVIEIGAGTGRYSRAVADMGYAVEAVELVQSNIDIFTNSIKPNQNINVTQGNALDLSRFADNSFDITLLLGPMYNLYTDADKHYTLSEAIRVTKPNGVVFVAYCISDGTIIDVGFQRKTLDINDYIEKGKINPDTFATVSEPADVFELVRKQDIDCLMKEYRVGRLHYVATDMLTNIMRGTIEEMDNEEFSLYLRYHFAICERPDMVGVTHHSLDVFRKI